MVNTGSSIIAGYSRIVLTKLLFHPVSIAMLAMPNNRLGTTHNDINRDTGIQPSKTFFPRVRSMKKLPPKAPILWL